MTHKQRQRDVIVVHCSWGARYRDHYDGDSFIEVWADNEASLPGIAEHVLAADDDLREAFDSAGIDGGERDKIMLEWLKETIAGGQYKPVWDGVTDWANCLGWWDVTRAGVQA